MEHQGRSNGAAILLLAFLSASSVAWSDPGGFAADDSRSRLAFPKLSFGFKGGWSFAQHTGNEERDSEYRVKSDWRTGFAAGVSLAIPIVPRLALQQEVFYVQKGSRQKIQVVILEIPTILDVTYDMDYIEIPILLRFEWIRRERFGVYGLSGTALSLKVRDRYVLSGEIDDGTQVVPLRADSDMKEVDPFDYSFVYGFGVEFPVLKRRMLAEYRFLIGWNTLSMPTYSYVPFGDEEVLIENEPVPLKNQAHFVLIGTAF